MISNLEFLKAIFGEDHIWAHVTSFPDDPSNISDERRPFCWAGDYFSRTTLQPQTNQYFTISTFYADEQGKARRRKALFRCTHVIVADDVREKLPVDNVKKLPEPTYVLETSPGSEQWGWVLDIPCQDRAKVENLLDGLVERGLAPDGKDPGMKGVTRYVRLPQGVNTKASRRQADGSFPGCRVLVWNPFLRYSIEEIARPFDINLDAERREARVDGAADIPDHPLLQVPAINVKSVRSNGRFDITCPWVESHSHQADDGAGIFTNADGSLGFKCHHGSCEQRTGKDLLDYIEHRYPGFRGRLNAWQTMRQFANIGLTQINFMDGQVQPTAMTVQAQQAGIVSYQQMFDHLRTLPTTSEDAREASFLLLKAVDQLDHGHRLVWWNNVKDYMGWTKHDLQTILEEYRKTWYPRTERDNSFYVDYIYVAEQNQFYNPRKRMWLSAEAFQNSFAHVDAEARMEALLNGRVNKVDRFDYAPGMPLLFSEDGIDYVNGWAGDIEEGLPGDVSRWLEHFKVLGWEEDREHLLKWMAFTLRYPERKINHMLILGGGEGNGKDFLLYPLVRAMKRETTTIDGDVLLEGFHEHLLGTKYLHINEAELGDRKEARIVYNKIKPLAASPPHFLRVNIKGKSPLLVRNIVNVTMTTNSAVPLSIPSGMSRRIYAVWTELSIRGPGGQMRPEWQQYWDDRWGWMRDCEGWKACIHYLRQVDLSKFDPNAVPHVTDYMKSIQEASEDPIATAIRAYIDQGLSLMSSDVVTIQDIHASLKSINMMNLGIELKVVPNVNTIGKVMKQSALGLNRKMWDGLRESRVWIIRNHQDYENLGGKELHQAYQQQIVGAKQKADIKLVKKTVKGES